MTTLSDYEAMARRASMAKWFFGALSFLGFALLIGGTVFGSNKSCAVQLRHHHAVALQPVIALNQVYPPSYYSVGAAIQEEAIAERVASLVLQKLATATTGEQPAGPQPIPGEHAQLNQSAVNASCVDCHGGPKGTKGGLNFTNLAALDCETRLQAITAVLEQRMPPNKALEPDVVGDVLHDFATAAAVAAQQTSKLTGGPEPGPVPPPAESASDPDTEEVKPHGWKPPPATPPWPEETPVPGFPSFSYDLSTKTWMVNRDDKWEPYDETKHGHMEFPLTPPNPPPFKN